MIRPQEKIRLTVDDDKARVATLRDILDASGDEVDAGLMDKQTMEQA